MGKRSRKKRERREEKNKVEGIKKYRADLLKAIKGLEYGRAVEVKNSMRKYYLSISPQKFSTEHTRVTNRLNNRRVLKLNRNESTALIHECNVIRKVAKQRGDVKIGRKGGIFSKLKAN